MSIPVTLVSGFLGAGKTSLINHVLENININPQEIMIIVNEIGEVGIDHQLLIQSEQQIVQLNNGCMCCSLQGDLLRTLFSVYDLFQRGEISLKYLIIETTGIADPEPVCLTVNSAIQFELGFYVDAVYTLVDAINYQESLEYSPVVLNQLVFANRFYVTKLGQAGADSLDKIQDFLVTVNPFATCQVFDLDDPRSADDFFDQKLYNRILAKEELENHSEHHDSHHHKHDHHEIQTVYLNSEQVIKEKYFQSFVDWLIFYFGQRLLRYKGLIKLVEYPSIIAFQGVRQVYNFQLTDYELANHETQLVIIGQELEPDLIHQTFQEICRLSQSNRPY